MSYYDLTRAPMVRALLVNRWPQLLARIVILAGFLLAILAGFVGTPVGSRNFSIIFVWIVWWALLILLAVPFFGRGWCAVCPIPMPGEWLQNKGLLGPRGNTAPSCQGRVWPRRLRNIWIQNGAFALLALFSAVVLTQPAVTALVLAAVLLLAIGAGLLFERRAFCRYLCPVGGFIGLYSQAAPLEVRVRDKAICAAHATKTCFSGNQAGYGCPWGVFPGGLFKNSYCGLCLECLRSCPLDNIAINIRPAGADLALTKGRRLDEAFKSFIMLGSAFVYSAVLLGPWGQLKTASYNIGSQGWLFYTLFFLTFIFGLLPGLFYLSVKAGHGLRSDRRVVRHRFIAHSYSLIPLGLASWIAFSLSFVLANGSYVLHGLSDPFGWGWDLFGTAAHEWTPYLTSLVPWLQTIVLVGGLAWANATTRRIAREENGPGGWRPAMPVVLFLLIFTLGLLWLLIG